MCGVLFWQDQCITAVLHCLHIESKREESIMKKETYQTLIENIESLIGSKENITYFVHCMTRLRFNLKDQSTVDLEAIKNTEGVIGAQWSNNQLQIVVGPAVTRVYEQICKNLGIQQEDSVDENMGDAKKTKFGIGSILEGIAGCLTPLISLLVGAGLIKVVIIVGDLTGLLTATMPTYQVLSFVADSGFYFLPIFIGATAAKKFGANMGLGMLLGAMLLHPTFVASVTEGTNMSVFGIPVYGASYSSTIFPAILAVYALSHVERFFSKYSPDALKTILVPFFSILIMMPLTLCLIAPAGSFIGVYFSQAIIWLYETTGFLGVAVLGALYPLAVITGMHGAFIPYMFQSLASVGYEPIVCTAMVISNINQGIATMVVGIKSTKKEEKSMAFSCALTAVVGGVTEPAMYGFNLKHKTPFYGVMIGSFIGALVAGILHVYCYAFAGSSGIFGITGFVGPDVSNIINMGIAMAVGAVATFIASFILYKNK